MVDFFNKIQEQGVKIVLASGRPTYGIAPLAEQLELQKYEGYILCSLSGWQESRQSLCCGLPLASSDCGNLRLISRKIPEMLLSPPQWKAPFAGDRTGLR